MNHSTRSRPTGIKIEAQPKRKEFGMSDDAAVELRQLTDRSINIVREINSCSSVNKPLYFAVLKSLELKL
ncbi:hypothetical protein O9992_02055 [Vibrio lentus]|nr:hypothetical protein [Vibrio lentus]